MKSKYKLLLSNYTFSLLKNSKKINFNFINFKFILAFYRLGKLASLSFGQCFYLITSRLLELIIADWVLNNKIVNKVYFKKDKNLVSNFSNLSEVHIAKKRIASLTKKQKKRVKNTKILSLVYKNFKVFRKFGSIPRSETINFLTYSLNKFVSDGYSWHLVKFNFSNICYKAGSFFYKTRVNSPIKFSNKGKLKMNMSQPYQSKVRIPKIKRKK